MSISFDTAILPAPEGITIYGFPLPRDTASELAVRIRGAAEVWPLTKARERVIGEVTLSVGKLITVRTQAMGEIYGDGEWAKGMAARVEAAIEEGMVAA